MEIWGGHGGAFDAVSSRGMDAWVFSKPYAGNTLGGDIHYLSACASGRILRVALADVSGHGETVSVVAETLRGLMRKSINTANQARLAQQLNRAFTSESDGGLFATAVLGTYWAPTQTFLFVNAGHPRPLISRAGGPWGLLHDSSAGVTRTGKAAPGLSNLPLGVIGDTGYEQLAVQLEVDDRLLLYTDFAIEARSPEGRELGEDGLVELLDGLSCGDEALIPELLAGVRAHAGVDELNDDATVVLLRHNASPMPPQTIGDRVRTLSRLIGISPV